MEGLRYGEQYRMYALTDVAPCGLLVVDARSMWIQNSDNNRPPRIRSTTEPTEPPTTMWLSLASRTSRQLRYCSVPAASRTYISTPPRQERLVIAVGGNALQRRGERLTIENMLKVRVFVCMCLRALSLLR